MKPQIKREVALLSADKEERRIAFFATADAIGEFKEFGNIYRDISGGSQYVLYTDLRFDFDEILEYITHYSDIQQSLS